MLRCAVLCYAMLSYATLYYDMLCCDMLCYAMIFKEATPHSAGPGVAIIITVSKEELRTWEGGF